MADYVDTVFIKAGEDSVTAESWGEHWQLLWEGWIPDSVQPPASDLSRPASKQYVIDAIEEAELGGGGGGPHDHNDLYYTEAEVDTLLAGKAASAHNHDSAYVAKGEVAAFDVLTQAEMDALIAGATTVATTLYVING
jgi:hypothetical protein